MKQVKQLTAIVLILCSILIGTVLAATSYVVPPGTPGVTPTANYTSWATAATNIQDAIDVVGSGGLVLVTNGTYVLTNQITVANSITVRSFNNGAVDRDGTIINGNYPTVTNRCVFLDYQSAVLDGFTITNGYGDVASVSGHGGGIFLDQGTVTNCLITGNETPGAGGGVYVDAAATLTHCTISGNVATNNNGSTGGGVYTWWKGGIVIDCIINDNRANKGGGVFMRGMSPADGSILQNSTIENNIAIVHVSGQGAAGVGMQFKGTIDNCVIISNYITKINGTPYMSGVGTHDGAIVRNTLIAYNTGAAYGGGITLTSHTRAMATNCVIRNNSATYGGGIYLGGRDGGSLIVDSIIISNTAAAFCQGGTARNCLFADNNGGVWVQAGNPAYFENCTIVGHSGVGMGFSIPGYADNCIVYDNNGGGNNWSAGGTGTNSVWTNSCTFPLPSGANDTGNITNDPQFVSATTGDYRLKVNSPCINIGVNRDWMTNAVDLDMELRIYDITVDLGCYESHYPKDTVVIIR